MSKKSKKRGRKVINRQRSAGLVSFRRGIGVSCSPGSPVSVEDRPTFKPDAFFVRLGSLPILLMPRLDGLRTIADSSSLHRSGP